MPVLLINSVTIWVYILAASLALILVVKCIAMCIKRRSQNKFTTQKNDIISQQNNTKGQPQESSHSPFLGLFWLILALVAPNIFFYSAVGVCWTSMDGISGAVLISSVFSWILVIVISVVLFCVGVYLFSKKFMNEGKTAAESTQRKLMDSTVLSGGLSHHNRSNSTNRLVNKKKPVRANEDERAKVISVEEKAATTEDRSEVGVEKFQLQGLWISVMRFAIMMFGLISLQKEREGNLAFLVCTQLVIVIAYAWLCAFGKKRLGGFLITFEVLVSLLVLTLLLMEAPSNRVKGNFINNFLTFSFVILTYGCVVAKIIEFIIELKSWRRKSSVIGRVESIRKSSSSQGLTSQEGNVGVGWTASNSAQKLAKNQQKQQVGVLYDVQDGERSNEGVRFIVPRDSVRQK